MKNIIKKSKVALLRLKTIISK